MARSVVDRERNIHCRTKVKTGCATCRIRKVKCDENKPFCQKCVNTGRTCDGYRSPFRFSTNQATKKVPKVRISTDINLQLNLPAFIEIAPQEIELLGHYFSTKTIFNVKLDCDEEARQILQASLTDPPMRHAVSSLRALREDFETSSHNPMYVAQQRPIYKYGLEQYSIALSGLASNLSSPDSNRLKSALLCCQIFISIEQLQGNYAAMAQHIIRGLRIMHEYRARPHLTATNKLMAANHEQLPLLDVFIIKMFAAPCKFVDPPTTADTSVTALLTCQLIQSRYLRTIAPDMRTVLTRIAASTLEFLSKVSRVASEDTCLRLLSEKTALLDSLNSWLIDLELMQMEMRPPGLEPISVSFMRCFHLILKIVLLGSLDSSPDLINELRIESNRLQDIANSLSERLRDYRMPSGINNV